MSTELTVKMPKGRKLYKIGHLTKLLGLTPRTIRYYDQFGLLPHVKRSQGRVRLFDDEDVDIIKKIRRLQQVENLPLNQIRRRLFGNADVAARTTKVVMTDSTASIPKEVLKQYNIHVIPLQIRIEDEAIADDGDLTSEELWKKSRKLSLLTQVVAPDESVFVSSYNELADMGYQDVYAIHTSSGLSETYSRAVSAAHKVSDRIRVKVVDSKSVGTGLGLITQKVARAVKEQHSSEKIELLISKSQPLIFDIFTLDSLKHLVTGGQLQSMNHVRKNLLEKLFEFKPVIGVKDGQFEILECCKTREEAQKKMIEIIHHEIALRGKYVHQIGIVYNYLYAEALEMINQIKTSYSDIAFQLEEGRPALSTIIGPEAIGISLI